MTTAVTEMRLRYLATERGGQLRVDSLGAYSIVMARDGSLALGPSATLATVQAYLLRIDPAISSAI
jgi:hypothetical protein